MTKIVLYIATSKDGYIADERGSVDWLPQTLEETGGEDYGYREFYQSTDAIAIGRKTYDQILGFGDWPYPGKPSYIFSRQPLPSPYKDIQFFLGTIPQFIKQIEDQGVKKLWLVGGSELIEAFYRLGRIDEFIITIFPAILTKGIPLNTVQDALSRHELVKLASTNFGSGVLQDHYATKQQS